MQNIRKLFIFIRNNGMAGFFQESFYRLIDIYYEKQFNVKTKGFISREDLGIKNLESVEYSPLFYKHIIDFLNKLPVDKNTSTLLDYGCGKGRVIVCAAGSKYQKLIGVEISFLINEARNNIDDMRGSKTDNIILQQCDAQYFDVPSDVNIIYFYNPFRGVLLEKVTRNIYNSYKAHPRKIYIVFFNNDHFDKVIESQNWLIKISQSELYPQLTCGIYETT